MRRTHPIIVGGGPAGAAAAITLARHGTKALVLERHAEPQDALCGGFLSWQTLETLEQLGVEPGALGGSSIDKAAIFAADRSIRVGLPSPALGVSRRTLDRTLLTRAGEEGAEIAYGANVAEARENGRLRLSDGSELEGEALFLATGKHELRGRKRDAPASDDGWMGLRYRLDASKSLTDAIADTIELHLFGRGYAGLVLQENGAANLCLALRRSLLSEAGGDPMALLDDLAGDLPKLRERLDAAGVPRSSDAIGQVPYGWCETEGTRGLFRIGDQAAVIPSLAGEGIGIALSSGISAANAFAAGGVDAAIGWQRQFARQAKRPIAIADHLKSLAERPRRTRAALPLLHLPGLARLLAGATRIA